MLTQLPAPLTAAIRERYHDVIDNRDVPAVNHRLREIAEADGVGVAVLVAWQHGLRIGHIPVDSTAAPQVLQAPIDDGCPYLFVHVPVRGIRGNSAELIRRGIMNPTPASTSPKRNGDLATETPCFLCAVSDLTPHEATFVIPVATDRPTTRRNYAIGFTFAPFGDPTEVCHFLAWDQPSAGATALDMTPTDNSIGDLLHLTTRLNDDIADFCRRHGLGPPPSITGVCNHWAGNTIAHQHYQFFILPHLPLLVAARQPGEIIAEVAAAQIRRVRPWPAAAYVIEPKPGTKSSQTRLGHVADHAGAIWTTTAPSHTLNTVVYRCDGIDRAVLIPRDRHLTSTPPSDTGVSKHNAGVLEMLGYFLIDDANHQQVVEQLSAAQRTALGDQWLAALTPPAPEIAGFEAHLRSAIPSLRSSDQVR